MKNFLCSENKLFATLFDKLLSDWSKRVVGPHDLIRGHTVKKAIVTYTPALIIDTALTMLS